MINVYPLAKIWRYISITSAVGLFFLFLLPVVLGYNTSSEISEVILVFTIIGVISVGLTYGTMTSKIITSPEGIECISFGIRTKAAWDEVERIDINLYGFVNLMFKESLYKNGFITALLRPFAYDRTLQLSPYVDDLATSALLADIAKYVPNSNISEFVVEQRHHTQTYQKVGTIGLYYLGWFMALVLLKFAVPKGAEYFEISALPNLTLVSTIVTTSLIMGFLINGMGLLGYNAEISELSENEIAHRARAHYLSPLVIVLVGSLVGLGIWAFVQSRAIVSPDDHAGNFTLVVVVIGLVSLRVSRKIERLIFQDKVQ